MKKFFIINFLLLITFLFPAKSSAWDLDMSVDEEIRRKYNTSAIEDSLPNLPTVDKDENAVLQPAEKNSHLSVPSEKLDYDNSKNKRMGKIKTLNGLTENSTTSTYSTVKIKKGTKFLVKSNNAISDATHKNAQIVFTTQSNVYQKNHIIPAGTKIIATVENSHLPQLTGNGGLIELKIASIVLDGNYEDTDGKVLKANGKKVFLNKIKGQRCYLKNVPVYANKGKPFYNKARRISNKLSGNPFTALLSPIPTLTGSIVYGTTILTSPVTAVFSKGSRIYIPQGSTFVLKLTQDVYSYGF